MKNIEVSENQRGILWEKIQNDKIECFAGNISFHFSQQAYLINNIMYFFFFDIKNGENPYKAERIAK